MNNVHRQRLREQVRRLKAGLDMRHVKRLPARSREMLVSHVLHGQTQTSLGYEYGVTRMRINQIIAAALRQILQEKRVDSAEFVEHTLRGKYDRNIGEYL